MWMHGGMLVITSTVRYSDMMVEKIVVNMDRALNWSACMHALKIEDRASKLVSPCMCSHACNKHMLRGDLPPTQL